DLIRLQNSENEKEKRVESNQNSLDVESYSGSDSEIIISQFDHADEDSRKVSEEVYKVIVPQSTKCFQGARNFFKGDSEIKNKSVTSSYESQILKSETDNIITNKDSPKNKKACLFYSCIGIELNVQSIMQTEKNRATLQQENESYLHAKELLSTSNPLPNTSKADSPIVSINSEGSVIINNTPFSIIHDSCRESSKLSEVTNHLNLSTKVNDKLDCESQPVLMTNVIPEQMATHDTVKDISTTEFEDGESSSEREKKLEEAFSKDNFPQQEQLSSLSEGLGMRVAKVKRWFMNKRLSYYHKGEVEDVIDKTMLNFKKRLLPYYCKKCRAAFVSCQDFKNHKREYHESNWGGYTCKRCNKTFLNNIQYDDHMQNGQCKH
ncbi:unnamed protein product, partial [Meganyctiphanes norvegica]